MERIKAVQIGVGHDHASMVLDSMLEQKDIYEITALGIPDSEMHMYAEKIEPYRGILKITTPEEALNCEGIKAAVIETEERSLDRYAFDAVKKKLDVHVDKPGGPDADEFMLLVDAAKKNGCIFHMGYMYRYNPFIIAAKKKIKAGDLGEIYSIEANMDCEHVKEKREWLAQFRGGMMFFLGCHLTDIICDIQGYPDEVIPFNISTGSDGVTAEDFGMAVLKYKNGVSYVRACAAEAGGFMNRSITVCGTKGTIDIRPTESAENGKLYSYMRETYAGNGWNAQGNLQKSEPIDRYGTMMRDFAEAVTKKAVNGKAQNNTKYTYEYEKGLRKLIAECCGE